MMTTFDTLIDQVRSRGSLITVLMLSLFAEGSVAHAQTVDEPEANAPSSSTPAPEEAAVGPESPSTPSTPSTAPTGPTTINAVTYSGIDAATVRIFAVGGIETVNVRGRHGMRTIAIPEASHGSGVVVSSSGVILTAAHVVEGARHLAVRLPNGGGVLPAEVVGTDSDMDYAILVVDPPRPLAAMTMPVGSVQLAVRQTVDAIGYPLDATREQPQSTRGIISAAMNDGRLQLGIAVNPGNSGGPLVDEHDNLVGIVVERGDPREGVQGIGVAVPMAPIQQAYAYSLAQHEFTTGRERLRSGGDTRTKAAEVVDALLRLGGIEVFHEAAEVAEGLATPDRMRYFARVSDGVTDPLLLAMLAAYFWDASVVAQERAGGYSSPSQMPEGPAKRLALEGLEWAQRVAQRAVDLDANLRSSPFIHRVLGTAAPAGWRSRPVATDSSPPSERAPDEPSVDARRGRFPAIQLGYTYSSLSETERTSQWGDAITALHVSGAFPVLLSGNVESQTRIGLMLGLRASIGQNNAPTERFDFRASAQVGGSLRYGVRYALIVSAYWTPSLVSQATQRASFVVGGDRQLDFEPVAFAFQIGAAFRRWSASLEVGFLHSLGQHPNRVWVGPRAGLTF